MATNKNFEYLGNTFQLQLLNQIILDKDFSVSIIDVLNTNYFENQYFKIIIQMVKEYYVKYDHTPSFETLEQITKSELQNQMASSVRPFAITSADLSKKSAHDSQISSVCNPSDVFNLIS